MQKMIYASIILIFFVMFSNCLISGADSLQGIGVIGDSYSDEYIFYPPDRQKARNWVELLQSKRNLNFGEFSQSSRMPPRNQGLAFNFAQDGDTVSNAIADGQGTGLATLISQGQIKVVIVFIGGDHFLNALQSSASTSDLNSTQQTVVSGIQALIKTIENASDDVKIVLATLPDLSFLPVIREAVQENLISEDLVNEVTLSVSQYNVQLKNIAYNDSRIIICDLAEVSKQLLLNKELVVKGIKINREKSSDNFKHLFLADGIHLGTIGQAFIANEFITSINKQLGLSIEQLKPAEIINLARNVKHLI